MNNRPSCDPAAAPIGAFVLDDHQIVRRGVRGLLEAEPDDPGDRGGWHRLGRAGPGAVNLP